MRAVTGATIFFPAKSVVVRPQKGEYLFYNSRTDELHLIPPTGHAAYFECDGLKSVDQIADNLLPGFEDQPEALSSHLQRFFRELETRGLVERVHG